MELKLEIISRDFNERGSCISFSGSRPERQGQTPFIDETCLAHEKKVDGLNLTSDRRCLNFHRGLLFEYPRSPASISPRFTFILLWRSLDNLLLYPFALTISLKIQAIDNWIHYSNLITCFIRNWK